MQLVVCVVDKYNFAKAILHIGNMTTWSLVQLRVNYVRDFGRVVSSLVPSRKS